MHCHHARTSQQSCPHTKSSRALQYRRCQLSITTRSLWGDQRTVNRNKSMHLQVHYIHNETHCASYMAAQDCLPGWPYLGACSTRPIATESAYASKQHAQRVADSSRTVISGPTGRSPQHAYQLGSAAASRVSQALAVLRSCGARSRSSRKADRTLPALSHRSPIAAAALALATSARSPESQCFRHAPPQLLLLLP
jgi:hypothetical protein